MCYRLDQALAHHCAPALAGIKPANLVSCAEADYPALEQELAHYNNMLNHTGIYFEVLGRSEGRFLLFVYRPQKLAYHLDQPLYREILSRAGYPLGGNIGSLLAHLKTRIGLAPNFPHEIGIFLGYPPEDVLGFVEHRGKNYLYCGYWKVYGNVETAQKLFHRYDQCRRSVSRKVVNGYPIIQPFNHVADQHSF